MANAVFYSSTGEMHKMMYSLIGITLRFPLKEIAFSL
jgi:hypothetical protein